jgi:2-hydroxychromene-2-carboxylate isomerase
MEAEAMPKRDTIDFYFFIGSMYTFLTVMRIDRVEDTTGVRVVWRPFSVRDIMIEMDNRPLSKPKKLAYMWRDLHRRAEMYGFGFEGDAPYPLQEADLANRVAVVGAREGWCADYARATYRRWFVDKQECGMEPNLSDSLREIGEDPARVIALAMSDEIGAAYKAGTDEARTLGIFGAPSFVARGEVFWGDDRLDDAVTWHQRGTLGAPRPP